jgi:hypothetical protein
MRRMSKFGLQEVLYEIRAIRGDIQTLNNKVANIEEQMSHREELLSRQLQVHMALVFKHFFIINDFH